MPTDIPKQRMLTFLQTGTNQVDGSLITDGNGGGGAIPIIPELVQYLTYRHLFQKYDNTSKLRELFTQKAMRENWQYNCTVNIEKYRNNPRYSNLGATYSVSLSTLKLYQQAINEYYASHSVPEDIVEGYNTIAKSYDAPL